MTPELKTLHSADVEDLPAWTPPDDEVCLWLELSIGAPGAPAADLYQVCVATPAGLDSPRGRRLRPRGSEKASPIVLATWSWPAVLHAIGERLAACAGRDWLEVQEKLRRQFDWEYEGMR